jgi:antitoxin component of MazEF toxin-antitoxin module
MARKKKRATFAELPPAKAVMETRVFKSGNSYAVRLPKPLYAGGEGSVYMKKLDNGKLLISPKGKAKWPVGFFESFGTLPDDFEAPERPKASAADDERIGRAFEPE